MDNDKVPGVHSHEASHQISLLTIWHADGSVTETIRTIPGAMPKATPPVHRDGCSATIIRRSSE